MWYWYLIDVDVDCSVDTDINTDTDAYADTDVNCCIDVNIFYCDKYFSVVDDSHRNYDISLKDDNSGDDNDCLLIDENESVLIRVISHATLYTLFVMTVTIFTMVVTVHNNQMEYNMCMNTMNTRIVYDERCI